MAAKKEKQTKLIEIPKDAIGKAAEAFKLAKEAVLDAQAERNTAEQVLITALKKSSRLAVNCDGLMFELDHKAEKYGIKVKKQKDHD